MRTGQHHPIVVTADTHEVLDGSRRVLAARKFGVELLRCIPVWDLHQAIEHMTTDGQSMTPSEMGWRAWHLTSFGKRTGRPSTTPKGVTIRPTLAKWFGVNEQVVYRLWRIYQLSLTDEAARLALKELDAGNTTLGGVYVQLFRTRTRTNRNPEVAKIVSDTPTQVTDAAAQRRAYTNAMASLQGITVALASLQEPSSQLTIDELEAWNKSLSGSRTALNRMARVLGDAISRKETT